MTLNPRAKIQELFPGVDLCLVSSGPAPDGQRPNFVDPPSLRTAVIAVATVMLALASLVLAGRLFVNRKSLRLPDWTMVGGFVFDVGLVGCQIALSSRFRHVWDTPICYLMGPWMKLAFIVDTLTGPALFLPKAAILLLYMEVFSTVRSVKIGSILGIIMAFMAYVPASLVLSYYNAPHIGQSWDELLTNGMTQKGVPGGVMIGVASVVVDIYIFLLPLPTVARLNLPTAKRLQVISLFATAFMGVIASVVCLVYRIKLLWFTDATWNAGIVMIPIIIENNVAIIVGSLPAFVKFMRRYIAELSIYKSFRSLLFNSSVRSKDERQQNDEVETFGGLGNQRKRLSYNKVPEKTTLQSQITLPGRTYVATDQI